MKKNFILFISLFLLNCASEKQQSFSDSCPEVLFSKDHRIYITTKESSLTLDNISFRAEINNYKFIDECIIMNNKIVFTLSILFVVKPEDAQYADIIMPYYIALLDDNKNIVDLQYYKVTGTLKKSADESSFIETEIRATQDISVDFKNKLLIGFMLNQEKLKILN